MRRAALDWRLASIAILAACSTTARPHDSASATDAPLETVVRRAIELQPLANHRYWGIAAEIGALGGAHPWAGSYLRFGGTDSYHCLKLAPSSGFVLGFDGVPLDPEHAIACGGVREVDGWIEFVVEARSSSSKPPQRLLPVHWDEWRCLLTLREAVELANSLNAGLEPPTPHARLWRARATTRVAPELPRAVGVTRFARPVTTKILGVVDHLVRDERGATRWRRHVELDFGARDGAFVGMRLYSTRLDAPRAVVEIESVETNRSKARALELDVEAPLALDQSLSSAPLPLSRS